MSNVSEVVKGRITTGRQNQPDLPPGLQAPKETGTFANEYENTEYENTEYAMLALSPNDPTTFEEAAYGPNKDVWVLAMLEELKRMCKNGT
jgi:hypothetical protein